MGSLNPRLASHLPELPQFDAANLAWELRSQVSGDVRFDDSTRAVYASDGSNYRQVPIGVVMPRNDQDVISTVRICKAAGVPVLSRGGGTSLAGQCCNVAVVMDFSQYMNRILEIDPDRRIARVQPGVVLDQLRAATLPHGLTFAPDPATHSHCTLGGMIGNDSCGVHSLMAGRTADNVLELDILLYDGTRMQVGATTPEELQAIISGGGRRGEIYQKLQEIGHRDQELIRTRYPDIPRRVSGYNLDELVPGKPFNVARALVGSEGTCVVVLSATLRLVPWPKSRSLLLLGYRDIFEAGDHVPEVLRAKPIGLEGIDDRLLSYARRSSMGVAGLSQLPPGNGFLMVEFGGSSKQDSDAQAKALMERLTADPRSPTMALFDDPGQELLLWQVRESGLGATAHVPGDRVTWEGWEDAAVPPAKVGSYLRGFRKLLDQYGYGCALYGHFGQGCIHTRIDFDLITDHGIKRYRSFTREAAALVLEHGGSLSGEHGDGQSRGELLGMMFGSDLLASFREFKSIWDPDWKMNPGKKILPYRQDEHLRLGRDYHPWRPATHFAFPKEEGDVAKIGLRCVGVGECRREEKGVMCPSYRATRDETHSTRGRARLLFEMLRGDFITKGWRSPEVKHALDLCLSCKGCLSDCPVNVDMASYKAEFLSHYYEGRLRPRSAYAFGHIHRWASIASYAPQLVNALTHAPVLGSVAKYLSGMAAGRSMPRFASRTFRSAFLHRRNQPPVATDVARPRVLLWVDTFTNNFAPEIPEAAVRVLEHAGYAVDIPRQRLCCGRPLYDYGFLAQARRQLETIIASLRDDIRAGTYVVGLEPSCLAVFRNELLNFMPFDEDAKRLAVQSVTLAELLIQRTDGWKPPELRKAALMQGHCHQRAVMGHESDHKIMKAIGLEGTLLDGGCCGMAGSFGFEREHDQLSRTVGEHRVLPAVRACPADHLVIADGFSCRHQLGELAGRRPLHLAQVLEMAIQQEASLRTGSARGEAPS